MTIQPTKITFIEYVTKNPYSKILTPISTVFGFSDIIKTIISGGGFPTVSVCAIGMVGGILLYNFHRLKSVRLQNAATSKEFYPFLASLNEADRKRFIIPRPNDLQLISESIVCNAAVYTIISGESGAGKTTLLSIYASTSSSQNPIRIVDDNVNSFYDILTSAFPTVISDRDVELNRLTMAALKAITQNDSRDETISDHFNRLLQYLRRKSSMDLLVLIFEQSERLSANIRRFNDYDFQAALTFFEVLRKADWIRVAFVTRNDRATDILTLLPRQSFDVIFINSLLIDNKSMPTYDIRTRLEKLCSSEESAEIIAIATKDNLQNTFVLALAGYIVEAVGAHKIINDKNLYGYDGTNHIISIYFKLLGEEYAYVKKDPLAKADLEIALYALALYNHRTNLACPIDLVARISHLPSDHIQDVKDYLTKRDLIKFDQGSHEEFRLAHDLLSEHVMHRENEYLRIDHALSMQQIVSRRLGKKNLIKVTPEKDPFISTIMDGRPPSAAAVLLWIAAIFYGLRIAAPQVVFLWLTPINSMLNIYVPGVVNSYGFEVWYFLPIAFTQYIWVLFIYGLDCGFFRYVTELERRPIMRWGIHLAGPFGAALGFLFSFAPSLFIIPIVIPGVILAAAYLVLWWKHAGGKLIGNYFRDLGFTTIANMTISVTVCAGLTELLLLRAAVGKSDGDLISLLLICILFWYFALAMRGRQGSLRGRAAMLAIYDSGRRR